MLCTNASNEKVSRLIFRFSPNLQETRIIPESLGVEKVDTVLLEIRIALFAIELKIQHEYKVYLFYSSCTLILRQLPLTDEHAEVLGQAWMKGVASEVAKKILRERLT